MAAFYEAIRNGFTIELDVHVTNDDVLVVYHDDNLVRLTSVDKVIEDCTFAEIRELVLEKTRERIPALDEVLEYVNGRVGLLIEIKQHPCVGSVEELLAHKLDQYPGRFAVASFDPRIVRWFYRNRPSWIRGQIAGGLKGQTLPGFQRFLLKNLVVILYSRPDFIAYEYKYLNSWIRSVADVFRIPLLVWTVRDPETAELFRTMGLNTIFEGFRWRKT
jgi:glycerophosphoryl diester phosphodiesterase